MVDIKLEDLEIEEHPEPITTRWSRTPLVLKPGLVCNGYSCRGAPPIEELRRDLRQVTREIRPN
ncbi:hypothetical protein ACFRU3_38645 [Streptomyces sp. NPDC056910]|uniref:hypothetical protein n=1 Tax=Streptomyces sp. NPDC056910 TaxID=3345964 RepID=UPI003688E109